MQGPISWVSINQSQPDREYLALITYLLLRESLELPVFLRYVQAIQGQLSISNGLIGYSMKANIPKREFFTLSIWEDEGALGEFIGAKPHGETMKTLLPHMGKTKFVRWKISSSSLPPIWEDELPRLRDKPV